MPDFDKKAHGITQFLHSFEIEKSDRMSLNFQPFMTILCTADDSGFSRKDLYHTVIRLIPIRLP